MGVREGCVCVWERERVDAGAPYQTEREGRPPEPASHVVLLLPSAMQMQGVDPPDALALSPSTSLRVPSLSLSRPTHRRPQLRSQLRPPPPPRPPGMRIQEVILEGFKSYPVRTTIQGWDESFNVRPPSGWLA